MKAEILCWMTEDNVTVQRRRASAVRCNRLLAGPISNWPSQCQATPNSGRSMLPADRKVGNS